MKEAEIIESGGVLEVRLLCEIDHHTAKTIREEVDARLLAVRPRVVVLDFSGVGFMDSSGIGLVLGRVEKAERVDACIKIVGLSPTLRKLVRMSGIEKLERITVK